MLICSGCSTPIELVKCKMQVQMLITVPVSAVSSLSEAAVSAVSPSAAASIRTLPGPSAIVRDIFHSYGVRGLWLGQTGTLIRETGGSAAWFTTKEFVASLLVSRRASRSRDLQGGKPDLLAWESAFSGACAGAAYNIALFPADTIKSTIQTEAELRPASMSSSQVQRSFFSVGKELYRAQGIRGLYAGLGVTVVRSIPSSAIIFLIYDGLRGRFG